MDSNCVGNIIIVPGHQNYENTSDKLIRRSESDTNSKDNVNFIRCITLLVYSR